MDGLRFSIAGALVVFGLSGCADNAEAETLLDDLQADDYRDNYSRAPGWEEPLLDSFGPHGEYVDIYINDVLEAALDEQGLTQWPTGSLIVKDAWEDEAGEDLRYVAVMEKRSDGSWFWAEYDASDEVVFAGIDEPTCVGCHSSGDDQVRAFELP